MSLAIEGSAPRKRRFFAWMALALALSVLWGFGPTYFLRPFLYTRDISWLVHAHALVYIGWIALFVVQTMLVARHRTDLHRRLGMLGVVWGAAVLVMGIAVAIAALPPPAREAWQNAHGPLASFLWLARRNAGNPMIFAVLFAAAIALRRRPQAHKRLMLLACIGLMSAAWARALDDLGSPISLGPFGFTAPNSLLVKFGPALSAHGALNLILLPLFVALVAYDLARTRSVHPATVCGGLVLFLTGPIAAALS